ncbi:MAG: hypothetical protein R8G60_05135 [Roseovarius pacificus]|nr:hypothetical protein [Roseovarius pacificus]
MKKIAFAACLTGPLAGCMQMAPIETPPAKAAIVSTVDSEWLAAGTTTIAIRSVIQDAKGKTKKELTGVPCTIESDEVRANVVTPQEVIVPKYKQRGRFENRGLPSALIVTCETDEMRGATSVGPVEKQMTTAVGGGLAVALVAAATSAAIAGSTPWGYPENILVPMGHK